MGDVLDYRNEFLYISKSGLTDLACDTLAALAVSGSPERLFSSAGSLSSGTKKSFTTSFESWLSTFRKETQNKCKERTWPGVSHPAHDEYWHDEFFLWKFNEIQLFSEGGGEFLFLQYISCPYYQYLLYVDNIQ